ncbi:MAG: penicillin acylase family protein [Erythrobacter sp.]|nr:MAG: penicillin acylase family protein [Erythrobacter sp.]
MAATGAQAEPRYEAEITRTTYGIPHIVAPDWRGLGYGVAYAYAQDNLCLMAEQFVTVRGERSLHFGPEGRLGPGNPDMGNLESDVFFRAAIDLPALREGWKDAAPEARAVAQGYVAGYNRFLADAGPEGVPEACRGEEWVRPIGEDDMLAYLERQMIMGGLLALGSGIANAAPPEPAEAPAKAASLDFDAFPYPVKPELGSNGWAFGGEATANGRGMVIGNPHFPWKGPNRFWQMHTTIPGEYDVMGVGLAGAPLPFLGFNKDVAWTHTVTAARHFTVYALTLDPADPTRYVLDGETIDMEAREVAVPMPGGAEPVTRTVYFTRFGPVVSIPGTPFVWGKSMAFAIRDANRFNQRAFEAWIRIGKSETVHEIEDAVSETLGISWVNTIAADRAGDALHADITAVPNVSAAKIEECSTPFTALAAARVTLLDGSRSQCAWDVAEGTAVPGLMPASDQASTIRRDYLTNSNDSYWLSNPRAPHPELSPILGKHEEALSLRTRSNFLETEALLAGGKIDHERAKRLVLANKSLAADMALETVLDLCATRETLEEACAALAGWDRRFDADSRGAYLFAEFWMKAERMPGLWQVAFDPTDPVATPRDLADGGAAAEKLLDALGEAVAELSENGIALDARWGDVLAFRAPEGEIAIHGGPHQAGVLNMQVIVDAMKVPGGLEPLHGSSYIQIVGFDEDGPVADAILTYSQSTNPASPHFDDQTRLFSDKQWVRLPFDEEEIAAEAIGETITLSE